MRSVQALRPTERIVVSLEEMTKTKEQLDKLNAELEEAKRELRHAYKLKNKHKGKENERMFYDGACLRMEEIQEEMVCLYFEIAAYEADYTKMKMACYANDRQ